MTIMFLVVVMILIINRKGGDQGKDRSPEEGHNYDPEWREVARTADDHNSLRAATSRSYHQETASGFLGDCP